MSSFTISLSSTLLTVLKLKMYYHIYHILSWWFTFKSFLLYSNLFLDDFFFLYLHFFCFFIISSLFFQSRFFCAFSHFRTHLMLVYHQLEQYNILQLIPNWMKFLETNKLITFILMKASLRLKPNWIQCLETNKFNPYLLMSYLSVISVN